MKKIKILCNILFWATLISPIVSFSLAGKIGEVNIFGVAGIIRYSWIMWLFIPIGVLSIIFGLQLKKNNQKYKKNYIIAFICLPLLIIFGSYRFIFNSVTYNVDEVLIIENKLDVELPKEIKVATIKLDLYDLSYAKIINNESNKRFEQEIDNNILWQNNLSLEIKQFLPLNITYEIESFDAFVFYNATKNEYNKYPLNNQDCCVFIAYDYETQRLIILNNYKIAIN